MTTTLDAPPRRYVTRGGAALATAPARRPGGRPAPAPQARPRHLRVVAPNERVRRRLTPATGLLLTALLFLTLFGIAVAHTVLVQGQVRLDDLEAQLAAEQARYQALRMQVAEAESPSRIVQAAQALGMVTPDDLVYLQPDAAELPAPIPTRADDPSDGDGSSADLASPGRDWRSVKPLLEAPAP